VPLGPLSGFTIAITADRRADEQASLVARRGGEVVHAPVIRTLPLGEEGGTRRATEELVARPADVVVVSTALGMRGWTSAAAGLGLEADLLSALEGAEVVARGHKAVGAVVAAGLGAVVPLPEPTYAAIVAAFADRPATHPDGRPVRVAVQLDGQDSGGLAERLAAMGFDVVPVPVYRWDLPDDQVPAERLVAAVAEARVDAVTFTSAHAVGNFGAIAERLGLLDAVREACGPDRVAVVAVGPVTAARAEALGLRDPYEPAAPRLGAMVQALAAAFAGRSLALDLRRHAVRLQGRLVLVGDGEPVSLTDRERSVLEVLSERQGAVVSKGALLQRVWSGDGDEHVVEVTVARLRRRLGPAGDSIETVVRRGYRLAAG
jgi:uroporphyrinogen-III synthase